MNASTLATRYGCTYDQAVTAINLAANYPDLIASLGASINNSKRKTHGAGRNGGRPKKVKPEPAPLPDENALPDWSG